MKKVSNIGKSVSSQALFEEARGIVSEFSPNNRKQYRIYRRKYKLTKVLPSCPHSTYKNKGWKGWIDFSCSEARRSFEEARDMVRAIVKGANLESIKEYQVYHKNNMLILTLGLPSDPSATYKNKGWISWRDFTGIDFLNFDVAREIIKAANLENIKEYQVYHNKHKLKNIIPYSPDRVYKGKGWIGWRDFLGKTT